MEIHNNSRLNKITTDILASLAHLADNGHINRQTYDDLGGLMLSSVHLAYKLGFEENDNSDSYVNETNQVNQARLTAQKEIGKYDAIDVAMYVINQFIELGNPITNLKLQKILYYTQESFVKITGQPCFHDDLVKWRHGPVVEVVYDKYRKFTGRTIDEPQKVRIVYTFNENMDIIRTTKNASYEDIDQEDRQLIDQVIRDYFRTDEWEMVDMTLKSQPCIETKPKKIITIDCIKRCV